MAADVPYLLAIAGARPVAVASLDEARDVACDEVAARAPDHQPALAALDQLQQAGGSIPLPAGAAITVTVTSWATLARLTGLAVSEDALIYAYNGGAGS